MKKIRFIGRLLLICIFPAAAHAQTEKKERKGEFYFSWGYNKEWYTHSNIHINQPSLQNNYTFQGVRAHDHPGWDEGLFTKALTIPQYNYRLGYFFDRKNGWAVEINFDHTKYIFADQNVHLKGTLHGTHADTTIAFNEANGFEYFLNNGANFLLFNLVKRWHWVATKDKHIQIDALAKGGIGPVIPHVQNRLFGEANDAGFQFGGLNTGVEGTLRATFFHFVYLEYCNKLDYAQYWGLKTYEGKAHQGFGTYEMILNLGITFPMGKKL